VNKLHRERVWFERWLTEGYSVRQLSDQSGYSCSKLYRIIHTWLQRDPELVTRPLQSCRYLLFDGSFVRYPETIVALMDTQGRTVIAGEHGVHERSQADLLAFFRPLRERGLHPVSCTIDGLSVVAKTFRQVWPGIIIQRCLVHIQRQGLSWCRMHPRRKDAEQLRGLFVRVPRIDNGQQRDQFLADLNDWEEKYGSAIASRPGRGKVFSDLKRARSLLLKALPNMFHYLNDPNIPRSTNGLEGYFARLKKLYRSHNGLTNTKSYCQWYFTLKRK
jgi:transposase-like protein